MSASLYVIGTGTGTDSAPRGTNFRAVGSQTYTVPSSSSNSFSSGVASPSSIAPSFVAAAAAAVVSSTRASSAWNAASSSSAMTSEFDAGGPSPRDRFCRDEMLDSGTRRKVLLQV